LKESRENREKERTPRMRAGRTRGKDKGSKDAKGRRRKKINMSKPESPVGKRS
jgi:hypothetical protein